MASRAILFLLALLLAVSGGSLSAAEEEPAAPGQIPPGTTVYAAAVALVNGEYGTEEESRKLLEESELDYWEVRHMANALEQGYGAVAQDVIDGKYGNNSLRFRKLAMEGYDPRLVQQIINGMLEN
jgi:hypothetical protein